MIKQDIERGIDFDWIGGDGLYGHNTELCDELDNLGSFYVLDVHKDEKVFFEKPEILFLQKSPEEDVNPLRLNQTSSQLGLTNLSPLLLMINGSWKK